MSSWRVLWVVAALLLPAVAGSAGTQAPPRPNVLFILADDLGWGDLSCYGGPIRTPNLDRLAKEGTQFTQYSTCGSVCSPSRCALFTGQYPARHKIHGHYATPEQNTARGMSQWLEPSTPNLARTLRSAGYTTAHVGKWHLGSGPGAPGIADFGFDFVGSGEGGAPVNAADPYYRARSTELFVNETLDFIRKRGDRPFYAQLWTLVPHATLNPTPEQLQPFLGLSAQNIPHKSARTIYNASVADLDRQVGRLLEGLKELGVADHTLVVFSSDNGPEEIAVQNAGHSGVGSPGPFRGRKRSLYEGGVRTPFLVRFPGKTSAGRVDDDTVLAGVDLFPTVCKLIGVEIPRAGRDALDGEDVSASWLGRAHERSKPLFWEWRFRIAGHVLNASPQLAIREGRWKLLMNPDRSRMELYDLKTDLMQVNNLATAEPGRVGRMSRRLLEWRSTLPPGPRDPGAGENSYPYPGRPTPARGPRR